MLHHANPHFIPNATTMIHHKISNHYFSFRRWNDIRFLPDRKWGAFSLARPLLAVFQHTNVPSGRHVSSFARGRALAGERKASHLVDASLRRQERDRVTIQQPWRSDGRADVCMFHPSILRITAAEIPRRALHGRSVCRQFADARWEHSHGQPVLRWIRYLPTRWHRTNLSCELWFMAFIPAGRLLCHDVGTRIVMSLWCWLKLTPLPLGLSGEFEQHKHRAQQAEHSSLHSHSVPAKARDSVEYVPAGLRRCAPLPPS